MPRRKKRGSSGIRRYAGRLLAVSALLVYFAYEAYRLAGVAPGRQARIFAHYANPGLTPDRIARLRDSPAPPRRKPDSAPWRNITRVVDGDTVDVDGNKVRLIGVDAVESSENNKFFRDLGRLNGIAEKHELLSMGRESARALKRIAGNRRCWLEFDAERADQYGRVLAYVHLDDGRILNEELLRLGYARVYLASDFKYKKRYLGLQFDAMAKREGFWKGEEEK